VSKPLPLRNVISYRVDDTDWIKLQGLRATFSENTWPAMFSWLFDQPEVQAVISARLEGRPVLPSRAAVADDARDRIAMARRQRLEQIEALVEEIRSLDGSPHPQPLIEVLAGWDESLDEGREESVRADLGYVGR
jgi:hypothetical protein